MKQKYTENVSYHSIFLLQYSYTTAQLDERKKHTYTHMHARTQALIKPRT